MGDEVPTATRLLNTEGDVDARGLVDLARIAPAALLKERLKLAGRNEDIEEDGCALIRALGKPGSCSWDIEKHRPRS